MDARALMTLGDMPPWLPWALVAAGVALLASAIYGVVRQARRRRIVEASVAQLVSANTTPRAGKAGANAGAGTATGAGAPGQDVRTMMVEIRQLVDSAAVELDRKADRLERLIRAADERIAQLENAGAHAESGRTARADRQEQGERGGSATRAAPTPAELAKAELDADPLTLEIHRLADAGMPAVKIAQKLGQNIGTVELILALRG